VSGTRLACCPETFYLTVHEDCAFASWLRQGVTDTVATNLMREAIRLSKTVDQKMRSEGSLGVQSELKKPFRQLMKDFGNEVTVMERTQSKLDDVTLVMQDNVRKMIENQKDLESLEENSSNLNKTASLYQSTSTSLRKNVQYRTLRVQIAIAIFVILVIVYIVLQFAGVGVMDDEEETETP